MKKIYIIPMIIAVLIGAKYFYNRAFYSGVQQGMLFDDCYYAASQKAEDRCSFRYNKQCSDDDVTYLLAALNKCDPRNNLVYSNIGLSVLAEKQDLIRKAQSR